ncbi:hypothetical protein [Deinococcus sp. QL22]|uniref:hypothetical protein n=1 Tax=Deinococcus sp. QL22 TaxID=2939437 RepID=UPI002017DD30|nr:hypothetical protein [Deinococcus sp. QL22]UQN09764.1 hypothetical protein M1R55_25170 [Deinococcus sp. QL22]
MTRIAGAEIAWNQVVNEPGKSRVEDNINPVYQQRHAHQPYQNPRQRYSWCLQRSPSHRRSVFGRRHHDR